MRPGAIDSLPGVVDAAARRLMAEQHAPGAALAIVHAGRVLMLRAYGTGNVERGTPVDASRTLFRVGSVTKPLTAAAVLQLVDAGRLDLHRDIRDYLPRLPLRVRVTAHQLLTHTAGFDEKFAGGFTLAPEHLQPLATYLPRFAHQAIPPGRYFSYGSTNYAVAGWLLETLSGTPYEEAIAARLFTPLGMSATTARQPPEEALLAGRVHGYAWDGAQYHALPFRYTQTGPAGAVSTTAADMSRFMLAILGDGSLDGVARAVAGIARRAPAPAVPRSSVAARRDLRVSRVAHARPRAAASRRHARRSGRRHPARSGQRVRAVRGVEQQSRDRQSAARADAHAPVRPRAGGPGPEGGPRFRPRRTKWRACMSIWIGRGTTCRASARIMPMLQSRVAAAGDTIWWAGRQWTEVAPYVFQAPGSAEPLVFRDSAGAMPVMQTWNTTYERVGWTRQAPVHLVFVAACMLVFVASAVRFVVTRRRWREGRAARCARAGRRRWPT